MGGAKGYACVLKLTSTAPSSTQVTCGKDVDAEIDLKKNPMETTTRSSAGWKEFINGLKEWTASCPHLWVPTDAGLLAIQNAFIGDYYLAAVFTDENGYGFSGTCLVTGFKQTEKLADAVMVDVSLQGTGAITAVTPP
jgi:predicted secreted protein